MKATTVDDKNLKVLNVVEVEKLADVKGAVAFEDWHQPGQKYTKSGSVRTPTYPAPEPVPVAEQEYILWASCSAYESSQIHPETIAELDKSERAVESKQATENDLPIAVGLGAFRQTVWGLPTDTADANGSYFARKAGLTVDTKPNTDFSSFGTVDHGFVDVRGERKTFLAGL